MPSGFPIVETAKYTIADPFLASAATSLPGPWRVRELGPGWPTRKENPAYGFLVALVRRLFHLQRWPGHEDRLLCSFDADLTTRNFFAELAPSQFARSAAELRHVYDLTQAHLRRQHGDRALSLVRGLRANPNDEAGRWGVAGHITLLAAEARAAATARLTIEMDTLNSFSATQASFPGYQGCDLRLRVDRRDIIMCSDTVNGLESDEYVVMNRHPQGLVSLQVDDVRPEAWLAEAVLGSGTRLTRMMPSRDRFMPHVPATLPKPTLTAPRAIRWAYRWEDWRARRRTHGCSDR